MRITIVRSSYYEELLAAMQQHAQEVLSKEDVTVITVPGAFEIPLACKKAVENGAQGILALGLIIEGDTHHAAEIARACTDGLMHIQLKSGVPIAHSVLFTRTKEQAQARIMRSADAAKALLDVLKIHT